jgi:hypothetical protein
MDYLVLVNNHNNVSFIFRLCRIDVNVSTIPTNFAIFVENLYLKVHRDRLLHEFKAFFIITLK